MKISAGFCRTTSVLAVLLLATACGSQDVDSEAQQNLQRGKAFLEQNKTKAGVVTLPSGLQYMILKTGSGTRPATSDSVTVHYQGMHIDGSEFDNSYARGEPVTVGINGMIPGWKQALRLMSEGGKWRLFIPHYLAYTNRGAGAVKPNEALIYEVELLKVHWMGRIPKK